MIAIYLLYILVYVPLFSQYITSTLFIRFTSIILIFSGILSINSIDIYGIGSGVGIYNGIFQITSISISIESFIFIVGAVILIGFPYSNNINKTYTNNINMTDYSLIIVFTIIGQSFLCSSNDLISIYLSIELQSFALYVICTLYRNSESATSAGLKYFLLGGLSSAVILLGSALIYTYTGLTQFENIYSLCNLISQNIENYENQIQPITLGIVIIGIGFLFKIAACPMHNWAPDVYDGAPTIVTSWLTTIPKISIFVFILEIQTGIEGSFQAITLIINHNNINIWKNIIVISSILSLIIGTIVGLSQYRIKRLLAYSTISHIGFILLSLQINSQESIEAFLFYIIQYSITNICVFLTLLAFGYSIYNNSYMNQVNHNNINNNNINYINNINNNNNNNNIYNIYNNNNNNTKNIDIEFINQLQGQFKINPLLVFSFSICLFSIAGIPPIIGFFGKQIVLYSSTHAGYYFISIIGILCSVISACYYLTIIKVLYFDWNNTNYNISSYSNISINNNGLSNSHSLFISILTIIITLFILQPQVLLNNCHLLSLSIFNY